MRVHVRTRNRMHQSAIVLVHCVPGSFSFRRHIGEDPGDEVGYNRPKILSQHFCLRLFGPSSPSPLERGPTELPFKAIRNGVG